MNTKTPLTESAQLAALRWLKGSLNRAEQLTTTVSGAGEEAEILATILAMLNENRPIVPLNIKVSSDEEILAAISASINTEVFIDVPQQGFHNIMLWGGGILALTNNGEIWYFYRGKWKFIGQI